MCLFISAARLSLHGLFCLIFCVCLGVSVFFLRACVILRAAARAFSGWTDVHAVWSHLLKRRHDKALWNMPIMADTVAQESRVFLKPPARRPIVVHCLHLSFRAAG